MQKAYEANHNPCIRGRENKRRQKGGEKKTTNSRNTFLASQLHYRSIFPSLFALLSFSTNSVRTKQRQSHHTNHTPRKHHHHQTRFIIPHHTPAGVGSSLSRVSHSSFSVQRKYWTDERFIWLFLFVLFVTVFVLFHYLRILLFLWVLHLCYRLQKIFTQMKSFWVLYAYLFLCVACTPFRRSACLRFSHRRCFLRTFDVFAAICFMQLSY